MPDTRTLTVRIDQLDYDAIQRAIAYRQTWRSLPDGDGDIAGRIIAEICRGWMEWMEWRESIDDQPE